MGFIDLILLYALVVIVIAWIMLSMQVRKVRLLKKELSHFQEVLKDLDEEAKLIIRTDYELNKTQEKLQKLSAFLEDMEQFSESAISTLDERLLFSGLTEVFINNLGFQKCLVIYLPGTIKHNLHFLDAEIQIINEFIQKNYASYSAMSFAESLQAQIAAEEIVVREIKTKKGLIGFLILANSVQESSGFFIKEMITTLSNVISQAIDNIAFFEESFQKRQELENKVRERTKEVVDALTELKKINRLKSEFISTVSHELRTPLTSIKGYTSLLVKGKFGEVSSEIKARLQRIDEQSDKLVEMVNGLLDIARIESGRIDLKLAPYNINGIIKDVIELLYPQAKAKNITVSSQTPEENVIVVADKELIERVLINLINNALKFTPEHGSITVSAAAAEKEVTVGVKDTGIGIAEEDCARVFDEFYRVQNDINTKVTGTGLGLSLVKKIIEQAHGGKIWVRSEKNKGSEFLFTLKRG